MELDACPRSERDSRQNETLEAAGKRAGARKLDDGYWAVNKVTPGRMGESSCSAVRSIALKPSAICGQNLSGRGLKIQFAYCKLD